MFPPQSTPSKRPKRRVESYRIYKRPYSACSQSSRPSPSSYEKATHGRLVGPTLSTPRGDKYYNQYRPLCEVCPRDHGKVVGTLQGSAGGGFASAEVGTTGSSRDLSGGNVGSVDNVPTQQLPRRTGRVRQAPNRYGEWVNTQQVSNPETQIWYV